MKVCSIALIVAIISWIRFASAQQWSIANLTTCGLDCLLQTIPQAGCTIADEQCQCRSVTLPRLTSACLLVNCTMHDSLVVAKVTASVCNYPHPDRSRITITVISVVVTTATIFTLLRLISKQWVSGSLAAEDYIIISAQLLTYGSTYFTITFCHEGFGRHIWDLDDGNLSKILKNFILALSKISILVFYIRIFPHEFFRWAAMGTVAMIVISTMVIFLMTVLSCTPVAYFWDRDLHGHCLDVNALAYANSAMSIVQDLIIIALPLPVLISLNMNKKRKLGVGFMFAVGGFGCIISMIRLKSLISFGNSIDPSWDYVDAVTWTILELAIAIICACLPAIRNLILHIYPSTAKFLTSIRPNGGAGARGGIGSSRSIKQPSSSSRAWRSVGSQTSTSPGGQFVELHDGGRDSESAIVDTESGEMHARDSESVDAIVRDNEYSNRNDSPDPKKPLPTRINVVEEVWVHSSPASPRNDDGASHGFHNV